jgi:DNA polymerase III epsilon subunit-like protein
VTIRTWLTDRVLPGTFGSAADGRRLAQMRFAVVDIDVTGTNIRDDSVTGIAVLPVASATFRLADLHYFPVSSASGAPAGSGDAGPGGSQELRDLVAGSPIVTRNPRFVREMLARTCRDPGLFPLEGDWVDLESAARALNGENNEAVSMDYWLATMKTGGRHAHDAVYDVFAMAQLLQAVISYSEEIGIDTYESLLRNQEAREWLHGG